MILNKNKSFLYTSSYFDDDDDDDDNDDINLSRFKFKIDDNLLYNKKINIPVCVISISIVIKKGKHSLSNI